GVEERRCASCRAGSFSFSTRGSCNCDPMGSVSIECRGNGTCLCRHGFTGKKCDKCQLNFYHNRATQHCQECSTCYGLVRDTCVDEYRLSQLSCTSDLVEAVAREALATSNRTHVLLMELRDDSTVEHVSGGEAEGLQNRTAELALHMQTKEELVVKIRAEMEPLIKTATRNLEMGVLEGRRGARDWPRLEAQTRLAVKKERPLEEKVKQVEKMLKPVLENTDLSNATAQEARETAMAAVKPMNLEAVKEDMEAAKLQLEAYSSTLTELIDKIVFHHIFPPKISKKSVI
ncbi:hypothetical protein NHX12_027446, partial [Muraenolepis orangiensis]